LPRHAFRDATSRSGPSLAIVVNGSAYLVDADPGLVRRAAVAEDVAIRLRGGESSNKTGWKHVASEVRPGEVYRDSNVTVTAFAVPHGRWPNAFGHVFASRDRRIVVSGDTHMTEEIVRQCNGCDVLVHEVYSAERFRTRPA
jgi:ribonuclease BN (tRNA processing enzyme)